MSSSFSGSTAQGRHFVAWSLVSWFFLLKEHGIMVVGFNILGLWSHKKSRQIGSWGSHWHGHVWMSWWGVWSLLPGPALPFLPDECMKPHFREAGSKHLALSKSRFVAPNHACTWIGLSLTSSPAGLVFPSCLHAVWLQFTVLNTILPTGKWTKVGLTQLCHWKLLSFILRN